MKGQKLLPMPASWVKATPPASGASTPVPVTNEEVHSIEAAVNGWMYLIKDVLGATSESSIQVTALSEVPLYLQKSCSMTYFCRTERNVGSVAKAQCWMHLVWTALQPIWQSVVLHSSVSARQIINTQMGYLFQTASPSSRKSLLLLKDFSKVNLGIV